MDIEEQVTGLAVPKIPAVGNAEAEVLKRKGEAINPGNHATIEVA